jgi:hypothetical protein
MKYIKGLENREIGENGQRVPLTHDIKRHKQKYAFYLLGNRKKYLYLDVEFICKLYKV